MMDINIGLNKLTKCKNEKLFLKYFFYSENIIYNHLNVKFN